MTLPETQCVRFARFLVFLEKAKGKAQKAKVKRQQGLFALCLCLLPFGFCLLLSPASAASAKREREAEAGFQKFLTRVEAYVQLHKSVEGALPPLKPTDLPEVIQAHQEALARKIREARPHARRGDIFGRKGTAFRRTIADVLLGPRARHARATIQQAGAPLKAVRLRVNRPYPEGAPYTTVPPTLLQALPQLPEQLAYRIVDRDLALVDVKANLVVDFIHEALP